MWKISPLEFAPELSSNIFLLFVFSSLFVFSLQITEYQS